MSILEIGEIPRWLAKIRGSQTDLAAARQNYSDKMLSIAEEDDDGCSLLSSPRFAPCQNHDDLRAEASLLIHNLNVALRLVNAQFVGIELLGAVERREDGGENFVIFVEPGQYVIVPGVSAIALAGGQRSLVERATALIQRDLRVQEMAQVLGIRPVGWGDLNLVYETVKGMMSPKGQCNDWKHLVTLGWVTCQDSKRFYETAGHYRHGHPRRQISVRPMSPHEAETWVRELFRRVVDHLEP